MRKYGLTGYPLAQSFSKKYFTEKFLREKIADACYELYELADIREFPVLLAKEKNLCGLNVTIPYKQEVIPFLDALDDEAQAIGAVNCIRIHQGKLVGFNTDAPAFGQSLKPALKPHHHKALVLGTGGAAKAVVYVLQKLGIGHRFVSRTKKPGQLIYADLNAAVMKAHTLIINCTPLGSFPKIETFPSIPYEGITPKHYLYDLVYNPPLTAFLRKGQEQGATIKNGYDMLVGQAEGSWKIWNG